nr:restriction endonuclease subunit S [Corynebacterium sp. LK33]
MTFDSSIPTLPLGKICSKIFAGKDAPIDIIRTKEPEGEFQYPVFSNGTGESSLYGFSSSYEVSEPAVTISARGTIGFHTVREGKFTPIIRLLTLIPNSDLIGVHFLNYSLNVAGISSDKGGIPQLTTPALKRVKIPVPPLEEQQRIVNILDKFDALVNDLTSGLPAEIEARRKQYEYYRDQLLTFKELAA